MVAKPEIRALIPIDDIEIGDDRREVDPDVVARLAASIEEIGLQHDITVLTKNEAGRYPLVAGRHRVEAMRVRGWPSIRAHVVDMTMEQARLWEISENLDRAELTPLQRDEQIAAWIAITDRSNASQVATHKKRGQRAGGVNAASRVLGIAKDDAHRAVKVASCRRRQRGRLARPDSTATAPRCLKPPRRRRSSKRPSSLTWRRVNQRGAA
jgi:ParB/RepB/Spo0J family partition protein